MQGIIPHLWFDTQAVEAATRYCEIFPDSQVTDVTTLHDTPSGDVANVAFELFGQRFLAISAGPHFTFTPAISFAVSCATADEVDRYWQALSDGGEVVMELGAYPFSERYGWVADRWGLSWQVSLAPDGEVGQQITPTLTFAGEACGRAEEAMAHWTSAFPDAAVDMVMPHGTDAAPNREGDVMYASFRLAGQQLAAMDSALGDGGFNEAISFLISCDDQAELDHYTDALSAVPEAEQCGWVKDRFGVSWQVAPAELDRMLTHGSDEQRARVTESFLAMKRLDLAALREAYEEPAGAR